MKKETETFCNLFIALRRKFAESAKRRTLKDELTFSQFEVLWAIGTEGDKSMEAVAEDLRITPPSATSVIETLRKKGFVVKKRSARDRRIVFVALAPRIRKHLAAIRRRKERLFTDLLAKLSAKDRSDLKRIMHIIVNN